jgi:hypothetical protein
MIIGEPVPDQLTPEQAAAVIGATAQTLLRWSRTLSFPMRHDHQGHYVNTSELRQWLQVWGHNSAGVALR